MIRLSAPTLRRCAISGVLNKPEAAARQQQPRRLDRPPGILAAGARVAAVDFAHRAITPLISLVVEVDRQHGGIAADPDLATIGLVDFDDLGIDNVLPAMVLEIACHGGLLCPIRTAHCG